VPKTFAHDPILFCIRPQLHLHTTPTSFAYNTIVFYTRTHLVLHTTPSCFAHNSILFCTRLHLVLHTTPSCFTHDSILFYTRPQPFACNFIAAIRSWALLIFTNTYFSFVFLPLLPAPLSIDQCFRLFRPNNKTTGNRPIRERNPDRHLRDREGLLSRPLDHQDTRPHRWAEEGVVCIKESRR